MAVTKEKLCEAIAFKLTEWLGESGRVEVINSKLAWFVCDHKNDADLSCLKELGIKTPKNYYDEKHWLPGRASFDFWVTADIYDKIHERVVKEMNNE